MLWTTASDQWKPRSAGERLLASCKSSLQLPRRVPSRDATAALAFTAATALSLHGAWKTAWGPWGGQQHHAEAGDGLA